MDAAVYEIRIAQHLGSSTATFFPEFTLIDEADGTLMHGTLPDQPALHGVLARIRDLGLTLIAVNRLPDCENRFEDDDRQSHEKGDR